MTSNLRKISMRVDRLYFIVNLYVIFFFIVLISREIHCSIL